jgi:DHA1 family tetracycline resistance protein-like MFS transporter
VTDPNPRVAPRRAAVAFIFVTVVLDMLALGIVAPVLPKLIESFLAGDTARAAAVYGLFGTVWALMQFLGSPALGVLADRYGRRPIIILSNLGLGLDYVLMALAPTLAWLFAGRLISGIMAASIATAGAYIADVTPPERRSAGFGMLSAAFGLGFVLGPALGGVLGTVDPRLPFWAAAGLSLLNTLYGVLVLPESLPAGRRSGLSWRRANPLGSLALLRSHPALLALAAVTLINGVAHESRYAFVLYTSYRYGWDARAVGLALAAVGIGSIVVGGGLVRPLVRRFGERRALLAGLAFGAAGFAIFGVAGTGAVFCIGIAVQALWGLYNPAVQGLMTRWVGPTEQGQLQGALGSLRGIAFMIGPGLFTLTFAHFIGAGADWHAPGAPFLLAALLLAAAMVLGARATRPR